MEKLDSFVDSTLSTILRHDSKQTSYKIALLRAINEIALAFPDFHHREQPVAIPLRALAARWIAYYWPFVAADRPIYQGPRALRNGAVRNDLAFRPALTALRARWEAELGTGQAADGFILTADMRLPRKRATYSVELVRAYDQALSAICDALLQPIQYAGPEQWQVFARPQTYAALGESVTAIPGTQPQDRCVVVSHELWQSFTRLSLWVEALCIHEWCLFSERIAQELPQAGVVAEARGSYLTESPTRLDRGEVFRLLTDYPENRRPLSWERHQIDLLMLEGHRFTCPWSRRTLTTTEYAIDHIVPLAVYPINELWNLVPADPLTNTQVKRARLPSEARRQQAIPYLTQTYRHYASSTVLSPVLDEEARLRFGVLAEADLLARNAVQFIGRLVETRNLPLF